MNNVFNRIIDKIGEKRIKILYVFIVFFVVNLVCFRGIYWGHDIKFHLSRVQSIYDCLKDGAFPALIYPNCLNGYGYANGVFYPDLFLYIPAIIMLSGLRLEIAYRFFIILINIFSFFSMYICIDKILKDKNIALFSAGLFVLSPYFIDAEYVRSALGENLAFSFLPLFILGFYKLLNEEKDGGKFFVIGICGIAYSHVLSIVILLLTFFLLSLFNIKKILTNKKILLLFIKYGLIAIALSAYMLLPLIEAMSSDRFLYQNRIRSNLGGKAFPFICLFIDYQIFNYDNNLNHIPIPSGIAFTYYLYICRKYLKRKNNFFIQCIVIALLYMFMCTKLFPWEYFKVINIIQFPWRLYQPCTVCFIIGISYFLQKLIQEKNHYVELLFSSLLVGAFTFVCFFIDFLNPDVFVAQEANHRYSVAVGEYIPLSEACKSSDKEELEFTKNRGLVITSNNGIVVDFSKDAKKVCVEYSENTFNNTYIDLPLIYYNGYTAIENSKKLNIEKSEEGLVRVYLDDTSGTVNVYYGFTTVRKISCIITFAALIYLIYDQRHKKYENISNRC